ncbi:hypothetical protein N7G274_001031 [Stereocaulon virgatum]|uniref:Extracellular mutant protein 11 C-terminal domain-containing protein n=1 Tax=Stereocaulon virgatum TaxID=373712 RepID=A0ABR4APG7_9LECA
MSGVQGFINGRYPAQQEHQGSPRQASATLFKVPVPSTRLAHSESRSKKSGPAYNHPNGQSPAGQHAPLRGSKAAQPSNEHRDGFDTDAESLEDTTIMSLGDDSRNGNQLRRGLDQAQSTVPNPRSHLSYGAGYEQRPSAQRLDQLESDDPAIEGEGEDEAESYSESGDEEDDEGGENGEKVGQGEDAEEPPFTNARYMQFNDAEPHLFRERTPGFKHIRLQDVLANGSPSIRDIVMSNPQKYQILENSLPTRGRSRGSSAAESNADQARSDQIRKRHPAQQVQPNTFQEDDLSSIKQPSISAQSPALNGTRSEQQRSSQPTPAAALQKPLYMAQVLSADSTSPTRGIKSNVADNGSDGMVLPPGQHKASFSADSPGAYVMNGTQLHSGDENATSISKGDRSLQFTPQHDEGVEESNERASIASLEGTKSRKRARDLDYSLDRLSNMTFEQLQNEAFDHDPTAPAPALPQEVANGALVQKLDYMLRLKEHETKASQRSAFFASLPIEQYEDCGDIIVEKFASIVTKFKDARRQRRKVVSDFEDEVAKREAKVRGKASAVEKDLGRLKRGGEEVVRGKAPSS